MRVPNAENAVVDVRKLRDYCLNPNHDEGKHKARMFAAAFGLTAKDAEVLRFALLAAVRNYDTKPGRFDHFGQRYTVDFEFEWRGRKAIVRSGWIIEPDSDIPRLTTSFPF